MCFQTKLVLLPQTHESFTPSFRFSSSLSVFAHSVSIQRVVRHNSQHTLSLSERWCGSPRCDGGWVEFFLLCHLDRSSNTSPMLSTPPSFFFTCFLHVSSHAPSPPQELIPLYTPFFHNPWMKKWLTPSILTYRRLLLWLRLCLPRSRSSSTLLFRLHSNSSSFGKWGLLHLFPVASPASHPVPWTRSDRVHPPVQQPIRTLVVASAHDLGCHSIICIPSESWSASVFSEGILSSGNILLTHLFVVFSHLLQVN